MNNEQAASTGQPEFAHLVNRWRRLGDHYGEELMQQPASNDPAERARRIELLLELGAWRLARTQVLGWLLEWLAILPERGKPSRLSSLELWRCLADVCERSHDDQLLELFWQGIDRLRPQAAPKGVLPLLGVPVLNGPQHLRRLLMSLDVPIQILAIVDQSGGRSDQQSRQLRHELQRLEQEGLPSVERVCLARPFGNAGVASAWNQILLSFPQASLALLVNHDVTFPPGVLAEALARLDPAQPQYLALFPGERAFSAFALTALAWDAVGSFDERYYPAYCEDLDYRDRLLATPRVQRLDGSFAHARMLQWNPQQSCTLKDDPALAEANAASFQLNRLWYSYRQRGPCSRWVTSGLWRQRWLTQWD
jgi:hypothetical protein